MGRELRRNLRVVTPEGDAMAFCHALYDVSDADAAVGALRAAKMFENTTGKDDPPGVVRFGWLETGSDETPRRAYGQIEMSGGKLKLECFSRQRLAIGRQLVEKHAGSFLKHVEDECRSFHEVMEKRPRQGVPEESELRPAAARELEMKLKEQHYGT